MKKLMAIMLSASMFVPSAAFAASNAQAEETEKILIEVKGKVNVPETLNKFDSSVDSVNGENYYHFEWSNEDNETLRITADSDGDIENYSRYEKQENEDNDKASKYSKEDAAKAAEEFIKKIMPEKFSEDDTAVFNYTSSRNLGNDFTVNFTREKGGVEVAANGITVDIGVHDGELFVESVRSTWQDKEFRIYDTLIESPDNTYMENVPLMLHYTKNYEDEIRLEYYLPEGAEYIDASTGEIAEPKSGYEYGKNENTSAGSGGEMAEDSGLTEEEIKNLDEIAELKSADEIIDSIKKVNEFDIDGLEYVYNLYKFDDNDYEMSVRFFNKDSEKGGYKNANVRVDAKTGKILSYSAYSDHFEDDKVTDDEAKASIEKFLNDNVSEMSSELTEKVDSTDRNITVKYTRVENGIPYTDNYISATWDKEVNRLTGFYIAWDNDAVFPAADTVKITAEQAYKTILEEAPIKQYYISDNDEYRLVYALSDTTKVRVSAVSGELLNYDGSPYKNTVERDYNEISGHWAYDIVKELEDKNISLAGDKFDLDKNITEREFNDLLMSINSPVMPYYVNSKETDEDDGKNDISKEEAVKMFIDRCGYGEIAALDGIYTVEFDDAEDISDGYYGYCALAKGLGIVAGDNGSFYPKKMITCAEALSMIYNYITR